MQAIDKELAFLMIGKTLGCGGTGKVYLADGININRRVALNFLSEAFAAGPG